jgi:hypothetical protein
VGDTQLSVFNPRQSGLPAAAFAAKLDGEAVLVSSLSGTTSRWLCRSRSHMP